MNLLKYIPFTAAYRERKQKQKATKILAEAALRQRERAEQKRNELLQSLRTGNNQLMTDSADEFLKDTQTKGRVLRTPKEPPVITVMGVGNIPDRRVADRKVKINHFRQGGFRKGELVTLTSGGYNPARRSTDLVSSSSLEGWYNTVAPSDTPQPVIAPDMVIPESFTKVEDVFTEFKVESTNCDSTSYTSSDSGSSSSDSSSSDSSCSGGD